MKRKNATRSALLMSVLSMLLCVSMLVGTTFAWFTDEVVTGMNTIAAGNLDVELFANGEQVKTDTPLFELAAPNLWEPGVVVYENLQVSNVGTLALKYQMALNFGNENELNGHKLSEVLTVAVIGEIAADADRADVLAAAKASTQMGALSEFKLSGELEAGESTPVQGVVIFWAPNDNEVDNLYNANNDNTTSDGQPLRIEFGVKLLASQNTVEEDSFDNEYDAPAVMPDNAAVVRSEEELIAALSGDQPIYIAESFGITKPIEITKDTVIGGNGATISRASGYTGTVFSVSGGAALTISDITVDGGAVWSGPVDPVLGRGTTNTGVTATGNIVAVAANSAVVLGKGAVLQNNDGAHAVNLGTRIGATLTLNGGEIINNQSDSGAVWGGGNITINSGKINSNSSTGSAGAIRMVGKCDLTMNGGEISNNKAAADGGAIWGYGVNGNSSVYDLNGGKMNNNAAGGTGGAIYTGTYSTVNISGDFEMCGNTAADSGAMRVTNYTIVNMTGGKISGNTSSNNPANNGFYGWCPRLTITGGELTDNITLAGGHTPTVGGSGITGIVNFNIGTNHNTINLAADFGTIRFTVAEGENFANFNFKPASGYTYTEGDEAKLICMNEGYETYWDAATGTFRLRAK